MITLYGESKIRHISFSQNCHSRQGITISNSQCESIVLSDYCRSRDIGVENRSVIANISMASSSQCDKIAIRQESKCEYIIIGANCNCYNMQVNNSRVNEMHLMSNTGSLFLDNAYIPLMRLNDCFLHEFAWKAGARGEMYIEGGAINHLKLHKTALLRDAVLSLSNVQVYIVQLQELLVQGQLVFRNIRCAAEPFSWQPALLRSLEKSRPTDDGEAKQNELFDSALKPMINHEKEYQTNVEKLNDKFKSEGMPLFRLVDCSMGKTEFTGSDLESFHFQYRDSKLLETFFSGTKLPKDKIKIYNKDAAQPLPPIAYFEQKVSVYNQLKRIYDNQGDIVEATWYHSKAMDNQERLLKEKYKQDGGRWLGEQWFDLLTFRLNKYTNNHGESWRKALRFIFFISLGMYCFYYMSLHYKESPSLEATDRFVSNYFQFLDLTHKIDFHVDKKLLWWLPVLVDFSGRILIGYGIYQFIAAFRRHGRKVG
jgi:hypothetical protein